MQRRTALTLAASSVLPGILTGLVPVSAWSQSQSLRFIEPFSAGGATDITARPLAEPLDRILGQLGIAENRAGAGGSVGMAEVARSAPEGLSLGVATLSTHGLNPAVYKSCPTTR